ncbi:dihydropteroate synthase, partial [Synergistaceae bacterium OttesenSCG-928-I11]|nr:dihydropteroate synthase [Synergistaceae bacterium OttesenSCG-928-I11]
IPLLEGRSVARGRTNVMGILNVNNDSFYAGSRAPSFEDALQKIEAMVDAGVDILDIGAESTRPGSMGMDAEEEKQALVPVVRLARERFPDLPISVDTRKAQVARSVVQAGADIVNDVSGLLLEEERDEMLRAVAETGAVYVLMHTKGTPQTMQNLTHYDNFWDDLTLFFEHRIADLIGAGIPRERIVLDPGIGFAKRVRDNLEIIANMRELKRYGLPVLIGASRKGFLGKILVENLDVPSLPPAERLEATLAVTALCVDAGIDIVRVHDVRENARVVRAIEAAKRYRHD